MCKRVAIFIPYFGTFPSLFPLWLKTCGNTQIMDFFLYTDQEVTGKIPSNLKIHKMSFLEFRSIIQEHFPFSVSLKNAYKICDYRPAFGEIFKKQAEDYDYWGYCDLDMIWGDIDYFIKTLLEEKLEKIFYCGHLTIYKNIERINSLYRKKSGDIYPYEIVFKTPENCIFDEWWGEYGISDLSKLYNIREYQEILFFDVERMFRHSRFSFDFVPGLEIKNIKKASQYIFKWIEGKLICYGDGKPIQEVLYVHLQKRHFQYRIEDNIDRFCIVPNIIIGYDDDKTYFQSDLYYSCYKKNKKMYDIWLSKERCK